MEKRTQVVVYGSSIAMAGIAASLQANAGLEVVRLNPFGDTSQPSLDELNPAVMAFDLAHPPSGVDVTLLCERPGLLLVAVDPGSDELIVVSSRQRRAVAVADLLEVIDRETRSCVEKEAKPARPTHPNQGCGGAGEERQPAGIQKGKKGVSLR